MENLQNNSDSKKTVLTTVVAGVVVLVALVWWMKQAQAPQSVVQVSPTPDAEAAAINQEVNGINVGDLNAELDAIDKDISGL